MNGDNLDLYVIINDVRMDNKSKDYYFFVIDLIFDRVECKNLEDLKFVGDIKNIIYKNFVLLLNEIFKFKEFLKVLFGRILCENIDYFSWMKIIISKYIFYDYENVMFKKFEVFFLLVLLKNE